MMNCDISLGVECGLFGDLRRCSFSRPADRYITYSPARLAALPASWMPRMLIGAILWRRSPLTRLVLHCSIASVALGSNLQNFNTANCSTAFFIDLSDQYLIG